MNTEQILKHLENLPRKADGEIYLSALNPLLKKLGRNQSLALQLWDTGNPAARNVSVRIADPEKMTEKLLDKWVQDLQDWSLTDAFTGHLVKYTAFAIYKAHQWAEQKPEFIRRAGFTTIAQMAWAKNDHDDTVFINFLPLVEKMASDDRFYVKKAVNWALRDIGKRNEKLFHHAQTVSERLQKSDCNTARWVGNHRNHK